ncbi:MAG TPA: flagellar FlbD family protein [Bryobacteraceae bacterium]|nr:flagellar FlbD family protein [Bryobacteraceae bacterium]
MINVTRLNRTCLVLNSDLIEFIESAPDTVITLTNDRKLTVQESVEEVVEKVRAWRRSLASPDFPNGMTRRQ